MSSERDREEIERLRAALRGAESRYQTLEHDWVQLQRQRRHTERLFTAAFEGSPEAVGLSRLSDGLIVDVNREWLVATGYTRDEVIGRTVVEIGHWPDQASRDAVMKELRSSGRLRGRETILHRKGGEPRLMRLNAALIDVEGESHLLIGIKDITGERTTRDAVHEGEVMLSRLNDALGSQIALYEQTEHLAHVGHWSASDDGNALTFSPGMQRLTGEQLGSVVSLSKLRRRIHPDDLAAFLTAWRRMDGRVVEFRWLHPDGGTRYFRAHMHRRRNADGGKLDVGVVLDVTAEQAVQQVLREKLDFIEKITSRVPDVLFQLQRRVDGTSWFPFLSESVRRLFGVAPEQARENMDLLLQRIEPEDRQALVESMRQSRYDGDTWQHDFRVRDAEGVLRWVRGNAISLCEPGGTLVSYGALSDVTERKVAESRLRESEERFRSLTDLSSDWYWETDDQFRFTRFDGCFLDDLTITRERALGRTRWELGALNLSHDDWMAHRKTMQAHEIFRDFELQRLDPNGKPYWVSISGAPMFDERGGFLGYRGVGRDITERKLAEDKTQRMAFYDALTALPNRRLLVDRLERAQASSARNREYAALLFIDMDNFKDLNDTLGHDVGDLLLMQVASRLLSCIREADTAARFGGDEFVVMVAGLSESEEEAAAQAEALADKILERLDLPYELRGREHLITPSMGIALFRGSELTVDELLKRADVAMYQAKAAGRNTVRFFDPQMQAAVQARAELDADLRQGIQRHELALHYQPVVDEKQGIIGYEALLRWWHPTRGLVLPEQFLAQAEQSGLMLQVGQWVIESACKQLAAWAQRENTRHLFLSVNLSARQFHQQEFVAQVLATLAQTGADPRLLRLELTETALLGDVEEAIRKMEALRAKGIRFVLDDFGIGYSSLGYLKRLPLDQLKIDHSFVRDLLSDDNDATIARTILALAQSLQLGVVAEGVESKEQHKFLLEQGCQSFQGYLFGRPRPLDELSPHAVRAVA